MSSFVFLATVLALLGTLALVPKITNVRPLPARRPRCRISPKYTFEFGLGWADSLEDELTSALGRHGFREVKRDDNEIEFLKKPDRPLLLAASPFPKDARFFELTAKIKLPLTNPAEVEISYRSDLVLDMGDLWKFCRDMAGIEEPYAENDEDAPGGEWIETGNPYQSPN